MVDTGSSVAVTVVLAADVSIAAPSVVLYLEEGVHILLPYSHHIKTLYVFLIVG